MKECDLYWKEVFHTQLSYKRWVPQWYLYNVGLHFVRELCLELCSEIEYLTLVTTFYILRVSLFSFCFPNLMHLCSLRTLAIQYRFDIFQFMSCILESCLAIVCPASHIDLTTSFFTVDLVYYIMIISIYDLILIVHA